MNFIRNNLITILVFAACIAGLVIYESYFSNNGSSEDTVLTSDTATSTGSAADLLTTLAGLKAVTLDSSIFSDPVFLSLVDFGIDIPPEPVGRSNPFAPLSGVKTQTGNAGVSASTVKSSH